MKQSNNIEVFLDLIKAGLWEKEVWLSKYGEIDYDAIFQMAEEQTVVGLVTAGIEHVVDMKVPAEVKLQFAGRTLQIEQLNKAMNEFVAHLVELLRKNDVYTLLVKGQGIAQSYERPLWRMPGDVDLFMSKENYYKAKTVLLPIATQIDGEDVSRLHLSMTIEGWVVELHGTLHGWIKRVDRVVDDVQKNIIYGGNVRSWMNGRTQVFLPASDEDIFLVFTHILKHFYVVGIGLRQICDWCRLIWTYRDSIKSNLLEDRLKKAGVLTEWKAFSAFAVDYLGMPQENIPLYSDSNKWKKKARIILKMVTESGNFGHGRDMSFKKNYPFMVRYTMSFWIYTKMALEQFHISPMNTIPSWWALVKMGANAAAKKI